MFQNLLKVSPEKSQILSCDTVVTNERYVTDNQIIVWYRYNKTTNLWFM